jgi:polyribonucleotide nucleotidyltransferase
MIPQDMIGELIGPGGKHIRGLIEYIQSEIPGELDIDIDDSGRVVVTAVNKKQVDLAVSKIKSSMAAPEIGTVYEGIVDKVMPYGAFVDVSSNISGLVHVSEMADKFVSDPSEVVKEGQTVQVKLIKIENGKLSFSMKQVGK